MLLYHLSLNVAWRTRLWQDQMCEACCVVATAWNNCFLLVLASKNATFAACKSLFLYVEEDPIIRFEEPWQQIANHLALLKAYNLQISLVLSLDIRKFSRCAQSSKIRAQKRIQCEERIQIFVNFCDINQYFGYHQSSFLAKVRPLFCFFWVFRFFQQGDSFWSGYLSALSSHSLVRSTGFCHATRLRSCHSGCLLLETLTNFLSVDSSVHLKPLWPHST